MGRGAQEPTHSPSIGTRLEQSPQDRLLGAIEAAKNPRGLDASDPLVSWASELDADEAKRIATELEAGSLPPEQVEQLGDGRSFMVG